MTKRRLFRHWYKNTEKKPDNEGVLHPTWKEFKLELLNTYNKQKAKEAK